MYRPSLTVTAVVLLLTLVSTTGATNNSGPGLPPKNCRLKTNKAKCLYLKDQGKCTKQNVFLKCQKVCDPRCQLGTPKPKCKNKNGNAFCQSKKHKCDKKHIQDKCQKTCGLCRECDNRVDDAVCDLVAALDWCRAPNLLKLCRDTCDPECKPCDDCEDTCVSNSAVQKSCQGGVCVLDEIIPCENKCDGDKVVKHKCEDGRCVQDGVHPCTDKCYGDILVPVVCKQGKCMYLPGENCDNECRGDTAVHRTCDGGMCVDESSTDCTDFCDDITAVDVACRDGTCAEVGRTDCVDKCDGDDVVEVLCDGGKCEDQERYTCEDTCVGDDHVLDRFCSGGECQDGQTHKCDDMCEGMTRVEMQCESGQCTEKDREDCESYCKDDETVVVVQCMSGECEVAREEPCSDQCDSNMAVEYSCENGSCEWKGTTPCDPVCDNNVLTEMVCELDNGQAQCVPGPTQDCPCGCANDGACIPAESCCQPGECLDECLDKTTIQLKTCDRDQCIGNGTDKCEDECVGTNMVAKRECERGLCICTAYEECEDKCAADDLSVLKFECDDGGCVKVGEEPCEDRCEGDRAISVRCGTTINGVMCMDDSSTPCKCGCQNAEVCAPDESCCLDTPECISRNPTTCDTDTLVEFFCDSGDCKPMETPCKCGCKSGAAECEDDMACCLTNDECKSRYPTICDAGKLIEHFCVNGDCEPTETPCKCGCDSSGQACLPDEDCCAVRDECDDDVCESGVLKTYDCLAGDCEETETPCKCGCKSGEAACEPDADCCVDDLECGNPSCDQDVLTTWTCDNGECVFDTEDCTCGCHANGMQCQDPNSCCLKQCDPDEVLENPDSSSCECRECKNDKTGAATDSGCDSDEPLCAAAFGEYGDECYKCEDDMAEGTQDSGCPADEPNCEGSPYGDTCFFCKNDESDLTTDTGCTNGMPLCGAPWQQYGTQCYECQNDKGENEGADLGCGGDTPNCRAPDNEYGSECFGTACLLTDIDICISVDGSGSLNDDEFDVEQQFVEDLVTAFLGYPQTTAKWGGNLFSESVSNIVNGFVDGNSFITAVNGLIQPESWTNIGAAFNDCEAKLLGPNSTSSNKLYILITDGESNRGDDNTTILTNAQDFKNMGHLIFTIGAGDGLNETFLKNMASDPDLFFKASSVTNINDVLDEIILRLCEETEI